MPNGSEPEPVRFSGASKAYTSQYKSPPVEMMHGRDLPESVKDLKHSHAFALVSKKEKLSPSPTLLRCRSKKTLLAKATHHHHHDRDHRLLTLLLLLRCYGFLERRFRRRKRCGRAWHPRLSMESGTGMCGREGSWSGEPRGSWRRGP
ncbi:hypothetical protein CMV_027438 [Castanea mollissima]|uniref:Uncharacterized protein n=1 Tax=Castanea mollissima TaxID=60419 RepID=A0A8J4QI87_9ROSI|nr:hypothetical protein CMV_027438 [Castanea mollissima]